MTRHARNGAARILLDCPWCGRRLRHHGTGSGAQNSWRSSALLACPDCGELDLECVLRPAPAAKHLARKAGESQGSPGLHDQLKSRCWCDTSLVLVDAADVLAGVTKSCGLPGCKDTTTRRPAS